MGVAMKIDFNQDLLGVNSKPLKTTAASCEKCGRPTEEKNVKLREMAIAALTAESDKRKSDGNDKILRTRIAIRISESENSVDLDVDEAKLLKDVGELYLSGLAYTRLMELLEPDDTASD